MGVSHKTNKTVLDCSFCEATAGPQSVASTAVLTAKVALVDSGEVEECVNIF